MGICQFVSTYLFQLGYEQILSAASATNSHRLRACHAGTIVLWWHVQCTSKKGRGRNKSLQRVLFSAVQVQSKLSSLFTYLLCVGTVLWMTELATKLLLTVIIYVCSHRMIQWRWRTSTLFLLHNYLSSNVRISIETTELRISMGASCLFVASIYNLYSVLEISDLQTRTFLFNDPSSLGWGYFYNKFKNRTLALKISRDNGHSTTTTLKL